MIVSAEMVSRAKRYFGLNMYEARLWLALVARGMSTAGELSELGNVPRSRTYDVLNSLELKGLITAKRDSRPLKYLAVPLEQAIENSKSHAKQVADEKKAMMTDLKDEMNLLASIFKETRKNIEATELIGVLKGNENVMHHTSGMIRSAEKKLSVVVPAAELPFFTESYTELLKSAKKRGVEITISTDGKVPSVLAEVVKIRSAFTGSRMIVKDGAETMFMLFPHGETHSMYDAGIWVTSPYFTGALSKLLEHATA